MGTDVERTDGKMPNNADDDLRSLEEAYSDLREETQQLINERTSLETEMRTLRKKIERLEENVNLLKMPPSSLVTSKIFSTMSALSSAHRTVRSSKYRSTSALTLINSNQAHGSL